MKTTFTLIFLCTYLLISAQTKDSAHIIKAYAFYDEGKYDSALYEINHVLAKDSTNPDYFDLSANLHFMLGNLKMAIWDCSKAIQLAPHDHLYYGHRAFYFYSLKMPDNAIRDNDSALKYSGKNDTLICNNLLDRGNAKKMKRDFQGAYEDYLDIYKRDSLNYSSLISLGAVLDDLGKNKEAIQYLKKAISLRPDLKEGWGNLGFRYLDEENYEKALELFNKVLELEPEDPLGFNNRGFAKYKLKNYEGALIDINKSIKIYPTNSFAYKNRALVYLSLKEYKRACDDLAKAKELGFTQQYGEEVEELIKKNCIKNRL
ncbi:MAG: tetratricopeptide repeat protein [Agriterribacter sp.]